ncbi:hypothetical protein K7432_017134 [Basidiobolus ranarum]|uniref:Uncharacterized protein n=1 Tax=Basidiobolus ranarum TaxID=34480 RepID=A0ABR2WDR3_9FUNG
MRSSELFWLFIASCTTSEHVIDLLKTLALGLGNKEDNENEHYYTACTKDDVQSPID